MKATLKRIKEILIRPGEEWPKIAEEQSKVFGLYWTYIAPLASLTVIASIVGKWLFGFSKFPIEASGPLSFLASLLLLLVSYFIGLALVYLQALIINWIAPFFGGQKNIIQALKVAAYSFTPVWLTGLLSIIPQLHFLELLGFLYSMYLAYRGLPILMSFPRKRAIPYTAAAFALGIGLSLLIALGTGYSLQAIQAKGEAVRLRTVGMLEGQPGISFSLFDSLISGSVAAEPPHPHASLFDKCKECTGHCVGSSFGCFTEAGFLQKGSDWCWLAGPFYWACDAITGAIACVENHVDCMNFCKSEGGWCCPVNCGNVKNWKCCQYDETCAVPDLNNPLCCPPGLGGFANTDEGPLCFDQSTEVNYVWGDNTGKYHSLVCRKDHLCSPQIQFPASLPATCANDNEYCLPNGQKCPKEKSEYCGTGFPYTCYNPSDSVCVGDIVCPKENVCEGTATKTCKKDGETCLPSGHACPTGYEHCGDGCYNPDTEECPDGQTHCPKDRVCGGKCSLMGTCINGQLCGPENTPCANNSKCCPGQGTCIKDDCCPWERACGNAGCCFDGQLCNKVTSQCYTPEPCQDGRVRILDGQGNPACCVPGSTTVSCKGDCCFGPQPYCSADGDGCKNVK